MRRELLQPDKRGRVALGRLGLDHDVLVADELEDGSWVLRPGHVVTEAEQDLASPQHSEAVQRAADDVAAGRLRPRPGRS